MNQSDIRGLVRFRRARADMDILRRERMPSTGASSAEHFCLSHRVDANYSCRAHTRPYRVSNFQTAISSLKHLLSGFGWGVFEKIKTASPKAIPSIFTHKLLLQRNLIWHYDS